MGLDSLGKLVGIGVGLATGNPALGAAAGSLFGGGGGGGGAAGGGGSGGQDPRIAFLQIRTTLLLRANKTLKMYRLKT
jgi:hypothetical protein